MAIFFAHRTLDRIKFIGTAIAAYTLIVGVVAWLFPENNLSYFVAFFRWFVALFLYFLAGLTLEWVGTTVLSLPFWERMPSSARVMLLVVSIVIVIIAVIVIMQLVPEHHAL